MAIHSLHRFTGDRMIFNHDILSCTREAAAGNQLYSGRALGMTSPDDLIQIHPLLEREWDAIDGHYDRVGLPHTSQVVWDVTIDRLADYPDLRESLFFFGHKENRVRSHNAWQRVVTYINNRNHFVALAKHLRMDVPHTLCFHGKQWIAGIGTLPYPCYLKSSVPLAGKRIRRCETPSDLIQALAFFDEIMPLQIQEEIPADIYLNLQYEASDERLERRQVTEYITLEHIHRGIRFPARCEPWGSVEPMAEWLWREGLRGVFAFEVGVVEEVDGLRFILLQCTPRYDNASYPSEIARRLQIPQWLAKEYSGNHDRLADIDLSGIEYDPGRRSGIILVNWGTIVIGRLGVLIAGSRIEQKRLEAELLVRLR